MLDRTLLEILSKVTDEEKAILAGASKIDKGLYTNSKELIIQKEKFIGQGKLIEVRPHTRFIHFPPHKHDYIEVIYMCKGSLKHIIDDTQITLGEGELLFLNQDVKQEVLPAGKEDIAINFIIDPIFFDTPIIMLGEEESLLKRFIMGSLSSGNNSINYMHFQVSDVLVIQNLMENMIYSLLHKESNKRSTNQVTLGLLFLHLMNHIDKMNYKEMATDKELIIKVMNYIEEHYREGSLTELSKVLNYDLYWMSRVIKRYTGKTYKQLLQEKRMHRAVYLLTKTDLSVEAILGSVGYSNKSYFYKTFLKMYLMTPHEYRMLHK